MQELVIVRGLPGSGKTEKAKNINCNHPHYAHLEADMWHVSEDGSYDFVREFASVAHKWCLDTTGIFLRNGRSVIVANTFITQSEVDPYVDMVRGINSERDRVLKIQIVVFNCTANYKSIHGVPDEIIEYMRERWEANIVTI